MPTPSRLATLLAPLPKALLVLLVVLAAAAWPVHALMGEGALLAMGLAGLISFVGFVLGRIPHLILTEGPEAIFHASLAGLGMRLLGTLAIAAPVLLFSSLPQTPFAVGLVLSYFALLGVEVVDLVRAGRALTPLDPAGRDEAHSGTDGAPTR